MFLPKIKNFSRKAFTLIEILLVMSLISVIGLAVFQCFSNGINVWKYSLRQDAGEDTALALDKFGYDLRNTFQYSQILFAGDAQQFSFPTIVRTSADQKMRGHTGEEIKQIGKVQYYFDPLKSGLYRRQANYSQALKKNKYGRERLLIPSVSSVQFAYYYVIDKKPQSRNKIIENKIPLAVRVTLEIQEESGAKRTVNQLFNIPVQEQNGS